MSSMRNAVQRRNHRERAQPAERSKWGILEKPKDYKLRAADHKHKRQKIKHLQQKASERNEDEFYFAMVNSETKGGVKLAKRGEENSGGGGKVLKREVVDLMKTQDVGYLRTVLQRTRRERERMEEEVKGGEVGVRVKVPEGSGKRKAFGDGEDLAVKAPLKQADELDDLDGLDSWTSEVSDAEEGAMDENMSVEERRKARKVEVKRRKLRALQDREESLTTALREVEQQRAKMNGTVGGVNKNGMKFKVRARAK